MLIAQVRQHSFPARSSEEEDKIVDQFRHGYDPNKEEVEKFKLVLKKLNGEKDDLVNDVQYLGHITLQISFVCCNYICVSLCATCNFCNWFRYY